MLVAGVAHAQFQQYIVPGSLGIQEVPTKERLEAAMKAARFHLGRVRLGTIVGLNNVTYTNNVYGSAGNQASDVSATVTAGLQGYLPAGKKLVFGLYALPQYNWWHTLDSLRSWGGQAGIGIFGYFNRVTIELQGSSARTQQYYSSGNMVPVNVRDQRASGTLEIRVLGRLAVFASGAQDRWRYENQPLGFLPATVFSFSDRDETALTGGLRYRFRQGMMVGVGYGTTNTAFPNETRDRSNSGSGPVLEVQLEGKRLWANVNVSYPSLSAKAGSDFVGYSGPAGSAQVGWHPKGDLELQLYGGRYISYTVVAPFPYYVDGRIGAGAQGALGWRTAARVFYERGRDNYAVGSDASPRSDDFDVVGLTLDFRVGRQSGITVGWNRTDYTSNAAGGSRSIPMFQLSLRLAGSGAAWW
jgi:hypothetical protein